MTRKHKDYARELLRPLIEAAGVNHVARISGVPASSIRHWLTGLRPLDGDRIKDIFGAIQREHAAMGKAIDRAAKAFA